MTRDSRERTQFRWLTIWLMPIPLVILVLLPVALLLKDVLDALWVRLLLSAVAVVVYVVSALLLRRALPVLEKAAHLKGGETTQKSK